MNRTPQALARTIARLALVKKADSVVILDLRELSTACDFFVLASGQSELQVRAIADHVEDVLARRKVRPWHVEGRNHRRWILMDYVDVVVHLFHKDTRDYYRLENLWADAPREELLSESILEGDHSDEQVQEEGGEPDPAARPVPPEEA